MIYTNNIKTRQPFCPSCTPFVIEGTSELENKLSMIEENLKLIRRKCSPSHAEFASLVQGLVFVVLAQSTSTLCNIADDIHDKVVGKPAIGKTKVKAGQGDFQSILFWTNEQAQIMLTEQQFVFFISPWSTGKTLCMKERAVMWATQNPTEKLFFVVVRKVKAELTSLLEMELKYFFHQQHNLQNVEVLGLPTTPKDTQISLVNLIYTFDTYGLSLLFEEVTPNAEETLSSLRKEVTTRPTCSLMVDELILPGESKEKKQFTRELEQLQNYFEAQSCKPPLWIACAGVEWGKAEHFEPSYLTSILPTAFHLPLMDMPLRNTKQTLAMAGLEENKDIKILSSYSSSTKTKPIYKIPDHLMTGVEGKEFFVDDKYDEEEVVGAVNVATKEVFRRTGGAGFPLLCGDYVYGSTISAVKRGVERAGATTLVYSTYSTECWSEVEVEQWLRRRRSGEEERVLIADPQVSRGWEASHLLVVDLKGGYGLENLVMRTVGYCALVKPAP